jgi:DNA-binding SARP family transcriptional activator
MFTLKLLGSAALKGPEGPLGGRASQRRRLAALALLVMKPSGVSRDILTSTLWPHDECERARHLLADTVTVLNRAFGEEVIVAIGDDLHLQPGRVACDARQFEDALERSALEEAVKLYEGPFLDGFFVEGSDEFDGWASSERDRLHALFERALELRAEECARQGDDRAALECWRRLAAENPYDSRVACQVAQALARAGDPASALQQAQGHLALLTDLLGISPPEEMLAVLDELRTTLQRTYIKTGSGAP